MAKVRIGHFVEARILEALEIDFIDESEVLTPADNVYHINKTEFSIPFVCGCRDLGEALRRIAEGASMTRTKGEAGTGNVVEAVTHQRNIQAQIQKASVLQYEELIAYTKELGVSLELLKYVSENKCLPVVNFAAGGIATPADAALMMHFGSDGVFVGSENPEKTAQAIVQAVTYFQDFEKIATVSEDLGHAMKGSEISDLAIKMAQRDE